MMHILLQGLAKTHTTITVKWNPEPEYTGRIHVLQVEGPWIIQSPSRAGKRPPYEILEFQQPVYKNWPMANRQFIILRPMDQMFGLLKGCSYAVHPSSWPEKDMIFALGKD